MFDLPWKGAARGVDYVCSTVVIYKVISMHQILGIP